MAKKTKKEIIIKKTPIIKAKEVKKEPVIEQPIVPVVPVKKNCVCTACKQGLPAVGILKTPQ